MPSQVEIKKFAEITKVDDEQRLVYGYASTEAMDVQGEVVTKDALAKALPEYMRFANIREMHTASAVGVAKSAEIDDKGLYISAKVVDDNAWTKVKEGVYKGFSIGGKMLQKVNDTITEMRLSEISLVDRPANPEAIIELWKSDMPNPNEEGNSTEGQQPSEIDRLMGLVASGVLTKGDIETFVADSVAKFDAEKAQNDINKYIGEEVYDASNAMDALRCVMWVLRDELDEKEIQPDQIAALKIVVTKLKEFIASEIMENNMSEEETVIEYADKITDIAKAGGLGDDVKQKLKAVLVDEDGDIAKADHVNKLAAVEADLAKMAGERDALKAELDLLKAEPAPAKGSLMSVSKSDDQIGSDGPASDKGTIVKDDNGNVNEVASLIKKAHQSGGVVLN